MKRKSNGMIIIPLIIVTFLLGLKATNKQMRKIKMAARKD